MAGTERHPEVEPAEEHRFARFRMMGGLIEYCQTHLVPAVDLLTDDVELFSHREKQALVFKKHILGIAALGQSELKKQIIRFAVDFCQAAGDTPGIIRRRIIEEVPAGILLFQFGRVHLRDLGEQGAKSGDSILSVHYGTNISLSDVQLKKAALM